MEKQLDENFPNRSTILEKENKIVVYYSKLLPSIRIIQSDYYVSDFCLFNGIYRYDLKKFEQKENYDKDIIDAFLPSENGLEILSKENFYIVITDGYFRNQVYERALKNGYLIIPCIDNDERTEYTCLEIDYYK